MIDRPASSLVAAILLVLASAACATSGESAIDSLDTDSVSDGESEPSGEESGDADDRAHGSPSDPGDGTSGDGDTSGAADESSDSVLPSPHSQDRSPLSGLPIPPVRGLPRPCGAPENLRVLDWAGFAGAVSYTYDDSQPSHIQHYAALNATGIRQTFYVNRETASGSLATWRQAVADGHEIGNHTVHHCRAPTAEIPQVNGCIFGTVPPDATADSEIDENSEWIVSTLGQEGVWTMATPFGDANWDPFAATRFLVNRDVFQGMIAPNDDSNPFHLPCYMAGAQQDGGISGSVTEFNALIDTARAEGKWMIFLFHTILPTADNWYGPVDIGAITGSVDHIRELGDVWADSMLHVGAYWRAQKMFSSLEPSTCGEVSTWTWQLPPNFPPGMFLRVTVDGGTLEQRGVPLEWDDHGYYEVALDAGELTLSP